MPEIDRTVTCQTIETMFANKLVAPLDRFTKHKNVASRDIYDIHYFFLMGYKYNQLVILERTELSIKDFLSKLIKFIEEKIDDTRINEDLNALLSPVQFQQIRKILKTETLNLLRGELAKITSN